MRFAFRPPAHDAVVGWPDVAESRRVGSLCAPVVHQGTPPGARLFEVTPMQNEKRLVLTVTEAATALGISRTHAYELVARGELPSLRLGRRIVVPRRGLERLLDGDADGSNAA